MPPSIAAYSGHKPVVCVVLQLSSNGYHRTFLLQFCQVLKNTIVCGCVPGHLDITLPPLIPYISHACFQAAHAHLSTSSLRTRSCVSGYTSEKPTSSIATRGVLWCINIFWRINIYFTKMRALSLHSLPEVAGMGSSTFTVLLSFKERHWSQHA